MPAATLPMLSGLIRDAAHPLTHAAADYDALLAFIGDARFVLLGEASHGTHDFYRERVRITKRLILEKGFTAVAVEADWPDAYRVNRYVQGQSTDADGVEALSGFRRFPAWMWRNADVLDFVGWLRAHNDDLTAGKPGRPAFTGWTFIVCILRLRRSSPTSTRSIRKALAGHAIAMHVSRTLVTDPQTYGYAAGLGLSHSCEQEVIATLLELQRRAADYARRDGRIAADDFFYAEQNALLVKDAEQYYRTMFRGRVSSWNLRDTHMAQSLDGLVTHLSRGGQPAKVVVWAHNSHLGDARATEMGRHGELNLGELVRRNFGRQSVPVGFTTYGGTVTAASDWGSPAERKRVRPALDGSYESLFHETGMPSFFLTLPARRQPSPAHCASPCWSAPSA